MNYMDSYNKWLSRVSDSAIIDELKSVAGDDEAIKDRFYRELEFGTGGLRGVIGAGTNRMNIYTVGRATQGFAEYLLEQNANASVAISYDSRINSQLFARTAAEVFAANGIKVYIYTELMPTPMLSFAVRNLGCTGGVMVTASHNPAKYNGYKAYGADGCQLTLDASNAVISRVNSIDLFEGIKRVDFDIAMSEGNIEYISQDVINAYYDAVTACAINRDVYSSAGLKVIYTPLHGAGNKPVREVLARMGVSDITVVKEQELPDGNFPTAPYPNPEILQAFECALGYADGSGADLLLATDPDSDRVGIAVLHDGHYKLLSGNDVGVIMLNYVLSQRTANNTLPANPVAVKTIVSSPLAQCIADKYGCELRNVLTGFKFIGEQVLWLEQDGEADRFVFGYEESYGYLTGPYVRDKDAVVASMTICEMVSFYKLQGKTLVDVLNDLYAEFGYYRCSQMNFTFEGASGMEKMKQIMADFRMKIPYYIAGHTVTAFVDYDSRVETVTGTRERKPLELPQSDVIAYRLSGDAEVVVRPSGTEPKIKAYITATGKDESAVVEDEANLRAAVSRFFAD